MNNPLPQLPPRFRLLTWFAGMLVGDLSIGLLYFGIGWLFSKSPRTQGLEDTLRLTIIPSFFLVPLFGGLIASLCWRRLNPGIGGAALASLGMTVIGLFAASLIAHEGSICLIITSPLLFVMLFTGTVLGHIWFKSDPGKLRISILPLLALIAFGEPFMRTDQTGVVVDEILIKAPASKVWPQLTSFRPIPEPLHYWLFRIGLPYPVETTSGGDFVGADRQCIFSDNMIFREKVTDFMPGKNLTFDITELPQHPELIGHITPERGQFLLHDNGDGTTTLTGSTWYTLHVRPLWYFDWWTASIFRAVHLRVMDDIRRRAES